MLLGRLRRPGRPRLVVRCNVPLAVALDRAARRVNDPSRVSDAGPAIVAEQYRTFQPLEEVPRADVIELDALATLEDQVCEVTRAIDRWLCAAAPGDVLDTLRLD